MKDLQNNMRVKRLVSCLNDFELGKILILPSQRAFIWKKNHILNFLDSLKKGYPIGAITFWQPDKTVKQTLKSNINQIIGSYNIIRESTDAYYILDGYQRLSTFIGCFMDEKDTLLFRQEAIWTKHFNIVYNLDLDSFEFNEMERHELEIYEIPLSDFLNPNGFAHFDQQLANSRILFSKKIKLRNNYRNFSTTLMDFKFVSVELIGGTLQDIQTIACRMNTISRKLL